MNGDVKVTGAADAPDAAAQSPVAGMPGGKDAAAPNLESQSLAGFIQEALVARTKAANRGTKPEHFFVITNVRHPAVLVEGGFLTNKEDIARLSSIEYREQIATAISEGIIRYRDLLKQRPPTLAVTGSAGAE